MTTYLSPSLSRPVGRDRIPNGRLAYFRTRNRLRMFSLVHRHLKKAGITKTILAERLGKGADQISHWLATPQNWTLDTLSDLLFAIDGAELKNDVSQLEEEDATNAPQPDDAATSRALEKKVTSAGVLTPAETMPTQQMNVAILRDSFPYYTVEQQIPSAYLDWDIDVGKRGYLIQITSAIPKSIVGAGKEWHALPLPPPYLIDKIVNQRAGAYR